jgi:hypothetical protein
VSSINRAMALLISHADVLGSYIKTNQSDQLLARVPKMTVRGDALQVAAVATLAIAPFITTGGTSDASETTYENAARSFPLRRIAAKVEVNGDIAQNVSMVNDVFEQQIQAKMVAMWNTVGDALINGTGADPLPAGLITLAAEHPDGVRTLGGALVLQALDDMLYQMRPWDGDTPIALVMNRGMLANLTQLAHAAGFDLPVKPDAILGKPIAHYRGAMILVSDWITDAEEGTTTSMYAVILGPRSGEPQYGGLVWGYNDDTGAGIRVDGPHRSSGTTDLLFATLEFNACFASLSTGSVLRMQHIAPYAPLH